MGVIKSNFGQREQSTLTPFKKLNISFSSGTEKKNGKQIIKKLQQMEKMNLQWKWCISFQRDCAIWKYSLLGSKFHI